MWSKKGFFKKKVIFYKVSSEVLMVEEFESMSHCSRVMNWRNSSDDVTPFNNVSLIARNNFCFRMELNEAHEVDM